MQSTEYEKDQRKPIQSNEYISLTAIKYLI